MGITSFYFICFYFVTLIIYYCIPKKYQWILLLLSSIVYFLSFGHLNIIIYPIMSSIVTYWGGRYIESVREPFRKKRGLCIVLLCNLSILFILKYLNFGIYTYNAILSRSCSSPVYLKTIQFLAPIGLSFYTLALIGYIFDVYYGISCAENNYFRFSLFCFYFPTIISGPILRYKNIKNEFFDGHKINYQNITRGIQRILWGFFKELVISERLAIVTQQIYSDYSSYGGLYIVFGTICFALQLYTNFSGAMDIVLGISETFGIRVAENFKTPFFSRSMQEFWRRWHITLGAWLKDYIFYPILRTPYFMNLGPKLKTKIGKKRAKQITTFGAMFFLWFAVGLWHGGAWKYIIGSGILQWFYIVMGEILEPVNAKLRNACHITEESRWFCWFQRIRTFLLVCSTFLFFNASSATTAFSMYYSIFTTWNPEILWNGSLMQLGLQLEDWVILFISLGVLFGVSLHQQKESVREWLSRCNIVLRWVLIFALLYWVIIFGNYGPGYSATEFIYQGF